MLLSRAAGAESASSTSAPRRKAMFGFEQSFALILIQPSGREVGENFLSLFLVSSDDGLHLAIFVLQQPSASFAKRNERQTAAREGGVGSAKAKKSAPL